jgi:hypothetical protein
MYEHARPHRAGPRAGPGLGRNGANANARPLSVLALLPQRDREARNMLVDLGRRLLQRGDHFRAVAPAAALADLRDAGVACHVALHLPQAMPAPAELIAVAGATLRGLLDTPVNVVLCTSVRASYAATVAIYLLAVRRPLRAEPAVVTILLGDRTSARYAIEAHHLRYLSDAVILSSAAGSAALVRHGVPAERVAAVSLPWGKAQADAIRGIYVETCARCTRRGDPALSYEF